jgi:MipA family protein
MKMYARRLLLCLLGAYSLMQSAAANQPNSDDMVPVGSWNISFSLGYGQLESPLVDKNDVSLYVLPAIQYYGERFYLDNLTLGYSLVERIDWSIDLIGRPNQDGLYFPGNGNPIVRALVSDIPSTHEPGEIPELAPLQIEPGEKNLSYMAGVRSHLRSMVDMDFYFTHDISGVHQGNEAEFVLSKSFVFTTLRGEVEVGLNYKSHKLTHYYYGIDTQNWMYGDIHYNPKAAWNPLIQLNLSYPVNPKQDVVAAIKYQWLDGAIHNSPLVIKDSLWSFYLGWRWTL